MEEKARTQDKYLLESVHKHYHVEIDQESLLGEGGFGTVTTVWPRACRSLTFAMKSIPKKSIPNVQDIFDEIKVLKVLDHPNIVKYIDD